MITCARTATASRRFCIITICCTPPSNTPSARRSLNTIPWTEWSARNRRSSSATSTRWTRSKHCSNTPKRTLSISPSSLPSIADCGEARHLGCLGATSTSRMTKFLSGRRCWRLSATAKWSRWSATR